MAQSVDVRFEHNDASIMQELFTGKCRSITFKYAGNNESVLPLELVVDFLFQGTMDSDSRYLLLETRTGASLKSRQKLSNAIKKVGPNVIYTIYSTVYIYRQY